MLQIVLFDQPCLSATPMCIMPWAVATAHARAQCR